MRVLARLRGQEIPGWERAFAAMVLLLSAGTGIQRLRAAAGAAQSVRSTVEGDPLEQALWMAIYLVSFLLLLRRPIAAWRAVAAAKWLWPLLLLALASTLWSAVPDMTTRRLIALVGTSVTGLYLGARFTWRQLYEVALLAVGAGALLSVAAALAMPGYGISPVDDGAWQGIFLQKNWLGRTMAFAAVLWLVYCLDRPRQRLVGAAFLCLSLALVLLSRSATSVVLFLALAALLPFQRLMRLSQGLAVPGVLLAGLAWGAGAVWLLSELDAAFDVLGRDVTLTGRTQLWELVAVKAAEAPWLGHGYGAFWVGWDGPSAYVWNRTHWMPPHAHNGFLDLHLELGWVGVLLFALSFAATAAGALGLLRRVSAVPAVFPLVFLAFLLLSNVTESRLLIHNSLSWILYLAIAARVALPETLPASALRATPTGRPAGRAPSWAGAFIGLGR